MILANASAIGMEPNAHESPLPKVLFLPIVFSNGILILKSSPLIHFFMLIRKH